MQLEQGIELSFLAHSTKSLCSLHRDSLHLSFGCASFSAMIWNEELCRIYISQLNTCLHLFTDNGGDNSCCHVRCKLTIRSVAQKHRGTATRNLEERWTVVDAAAACLTKQNRHFSMLSSTLANTPFHLSVHWLSCYDNSLRGLSFPGCCVTSLGHMSLLNNRSSVSEGAKECLRRWQKCLLMASQWLLLLATLHRL